MVVVCPPGMMSLPPLHPFLNPPSTTCASMSSFPTTTSFQSDMSMESDEMDPPPPYTTTVKKPTELLTTHVASFFEPSSPFTSQDPYQAGHNDEMMDSSDVMFDQGPSGRNHERRDVDRSPSTLSSRRGTALHRLVIHRQAPGKVAKQSCTGHSSCGAASSNADGHCDPLFQHKPVIPTRLRTTIQSRPSTPSSSPATSPTRRLRTSTPASYIPVPTPPRFHSRHQLNQVPPPSPTGAGLVPAAPSPLRRSFMFDDASRHPTTQIQQPQNPFSDDSMDYNGAKTGPSSNSEDSSSSSSEKTKSDVLLEALAKVWGSPLRRRSGPLHVSRLARHTPSSPSSNASRQRQRAVSSPIIFPPPPPTLPPLHAFASNGSVEGVLSILNTTSTIPLNHPDPKGRTALHLASANGHVDVIAALISLIPSDTPCGEFLDAPDSNGSSPLHLAALSGRMECVLALLRAGADPGRGDGFGRTPLDLVKARMRLIAGRNVKTTFSMKSREGMEEDPRAARERLIMELKQMVDILQFYAPSSSTPINRQGSDASPSATLLTRSSSFAAIPVIHTSFDHHRDGFLHRRPPRNRGVSEPTALANGGTRAQPPGAVLDLEALTAKLMVLSTGQAAAGGRGGNAGMEVEGGEEDVDALQGDTVDVAGAGDELDGIVDEIQALLNRLTV